MAIANASLSESVGNLLNKVNETIVVVNDLTNEINTDNIVANTANILTLDAGSINYETIDGGAITSDDLINVTGSGTKITANSGLISGAIIRASSNLISGGDIYASDDLTVHDDLVVGGVANIAFQTTVGSLITDGRISANSSYVSANIFVANSAKIGVSTLATISTTGAITGSNVISTGDLYASDDLFVQDDASINGTLRVNESAFANNGRFYGDYINGTIAVAGGTGAFTSLNVGPGGGGTITTTGDITSGGNISTGSSTGRNISSLGQIRAGSFDETSGTLGGFVIQSSVGGGNPHGVHVITFDVELLSGTATFDIDITRFFNADGFYYNYATIYISGISLFSDAEPTTVNQLHKSIHFGAYYNDSAKRSGGTDAWVLTTQTLNDAQYQSDATNFIAGTAAAGQFVTIVGGQVILRLTNDIRHASNPTMTTYFTATLRVQEV